MAARRPLAQKRTDNAARSRWTASTRFAGRPRRFYLASAECPHNLVSERLEEVGQRCARFGLNEGLDGHPMEMSSVIFIAHPPTPDPRWRDNITNSSVTSASGT